MDDGTREPARERVTIDDVAAAVGVSIMSVSRAMRGVEGLSVKRRAQILQAARDMGYAPSSVAGSLAAANSTLIGVSVPTLHDEVFSDIFDGMRQVFTRQGFQTVFDTTDYTHENEDRWIDRMLAWRPAGIVLSGVDQSPRSIQRLRADNIPVIQVWDVRDDPIDMCIGIDHHAAGYDMGAYLVGCGYRRIAYVGVKNGFDARAEKRLAGFERALADHSCTLHSEGRVGAERSFVAGQRGTQAVLDAGAPYPDAIYYMNDYMALGGVIACEERALAVPGQIGIAGFNDLALNHVMPMSLTTSATPRREMGRKGADLLVARIRGVRSQAGVTMPVELKPGRTTCRYPPSGGAA